MTPRWRALARMLWHAVFYSVALCTLPTALCVAMSDLIARGMFWPKLESVLIFSVVFSGILWLICGLTFGIAMVAVTLLFNPSIHDRRRFQILMASVPVGLLLLAHLLLNTREDTASYLRALAHGPAWIKAHFLLFVLALLASIGICRTVAGKYVREVSPRKRKEKPA